MRKHRIFGKKIDAVCIDPPSKLQNPFKAGKFLWECGGSDRWEIELPLKDGKKFIPDEETALFCYEFMMTKTYKAPPRIAIAKRRLKGRDWATFKPLNEKSHGDILEIIMEKL